MKLQPTHLLHIDGSSRTMWVCCRRRWMQCPGMCYKLPSCLPPGVFSLSDGQRNGWLDKWIKHKWGYGKHWVRMRSEMCKHSQRTNEQLGTVGVFGRERSSDSLWWRFIVLFLLLSIFTNMRRHHWIPKPPSWYWVCRVGVEMEQMSKRYNDENPKWGRKTIQVKLFSKWYKKTFKITVNTMCFLTWWKMCGLQKWSFPCIKVSVHSDAWTNQTVITRKIRLFQIS